jgi:uncharacterized protein
VEPSEIPLFPLESVVLFPAVHCPLHIFEPRYREMTRHALTGAGRIGMVTVRPEHTADMAGNPPVFAIGCEGVIRESRELPDGRFNLLLEGTRRFRIHREHTLPPAEGRLFRVAEIERLDDPLPEADRGAVRQLRGEIVQLVTELVQQIAPDRAETLAQNFDRVDDVAFVNTLSQSVDFTPLEKQGLLESGTVLDRFARLRDLMRFRLVEVRGGAPSPRETVH